MQRKVIALACCLVACSKAPDDIGPGEVTTAAPGVAFSYRYSFQLPSAMIDETQEAHAQACEKLGPANCRITGMTYTQDANGDADASLELRVAAPLARRFGRAGIETVERAGGTLTQAAILGVDAAPATAEAQKSGADAEDDLSALDRKLADKTLPAGLRRDLTARRAELVAKQREAAKAEADIRTSVATTPIAFAYHAGNGLGAAARMIEAAHAAKTSLRWTLATLLLALAYVGPPLLVALLLAIFWLRIGRRWWHHIFIRDQAN